MDQGAVSLGTFVTNLLLARALAPAEYGVYALIFGVALFLNNLFFAVVTYPLSIRGAIADESELRRLTLNALGVASVVLLPIAVVIGAATAVVGRVDLAIPAVVAVVLWQLQETLRRALLAHLRHRTAVAGDAVSYLGQAALLGAVGQYTPLSPLAAFGSMALTSAVAGLLQVWQLGLRPQGAGGLAAALSDAWRTGRWILGSQLVNGLGFQALPWVLALARGTAETAAFQAALNIVSVTNPVIFSIANLMLPTAARAADKQGLPGAYRAGFRSIAQGGFVLLPFFAVIAVAPEPVLALVYGSSSPYRATGDALRIFAVAYMLFYIGGLLVTLLTSLEETRKVFASQLASAVGGIVIGVPITLWLGLTGACIGVFGIHFTRALVSGVLLFRLRSCES
jgi:O-antigen/teichoic acid export membrane protein